MGELANPNPQSEGMKLMSKLGVGMITTEIYTLSLRDALPIWPIWFHNIIS